MKQYPFNACTNIEEVEEIKVEGENPLSEITDIFETAEKKQYARNVYALLMLLVEFVG